MTSLAVSLFALGAAAVALGYAILSLGVLAQRSGRQDLPFAAAMAMTAGWLATMAAAGPLSAVALVMECGRNLAWFWMMAVVAGQSGAPRRIGAVGWIYLGLFSLQAVLLALVALPGVLSLKPMLDGPHFATVMMLVAAGALVLLHNLYDAGRRDRANELFLPVAALAVIWAYDLNLYAISYLGGSPASLMELLRPLPLLAALLLFAASMLRPGSRTVRLSRPATFRSLAVAAILGWLGLLTGLSIIADASSARFSSLAQIVILSVGGALMVLAVVSSRLRAHARVMVAKHLFEHRYDYRGEWLRFTETLTRQATPPQPIELRALRAIADIVESPGGFLVTRGEDGFAPAAAWPDAGDLPPDIDWSALAGLLSDGEWIVQLDTVRAHSGSDSERSAVPAVLVERQDIWTIVPLVHADQLEGMAILLRPVVDRALDWEDFDLLRVAGRQAASHIAEARGSTALAESARFEEFHRRFAFVMHDVKNLASQTALLARNVDRHGDNPDFREDMAQTLRLCAERLGQLTQRLSQQERVRINAPAPVALVALAERMAIARRMQHPVEVIGDASVRALGDAPVIEQLLAHLVQNAIDASPAGEPVTVRVTSASGRASLTVEDRGIGMSLGFVRNELFRPFVSTKDGGFGIGAYQARKLAEAMGGQLDVESREGEGTIFTLSLPLAAAGGETTHGSIAA